MVSRAHARLYKYAKVEGEKHQFSKVKRFFLQYVFSKNTAIKEIIRKDT